MKIYNWKKRLSLRLAELDKKQDELATELGVEPTTVSSWVKRDRTPPLSRFVDMAECLQTTPEWLAFGVERTEIDVTLLIKCINAVEKASKANQITPSSNHKIKLAVRLYSEYSSKPQSPLRSVAATAMKLMG